MNSWYRLVPITAFAVIISYTLSPHAYNTVTFWGPFIIAFILSFLACSWWAVIAVPTALLVGYWLISYSIEPRETDKETVVIIVLIIYCFTIVSAAVGTMLSKLAVYAAQDYIGGVASYESKDDDRPQ